MYIAADAVLLAVIIICAIIGLVKGFINQILDLFSGIAAFFTAYFLSPLLAPFVNSRLFYGPISNYASGVISNMYGSAGVAELFGDGPVNESFRSFIGKFGADYDAIRQSFAEKAAHSAEEAIAGITEKVVSPVSYALAYALCFIVIFISALVLLWLIKHLLNLAAKLPVLKQANKILGLVAGTALGILVVWVITIGLKLALPYLNVMAPSAFPEDLFDKTFLLKFFYNVNVLRPLINISKIITV